MDSNDLVGMGVNRIDFNAFRWVYRFQAMGVACIPGRSLGLHVVPAKRCIRSPKGTLRAMATATSPLPAGVRQTKVKRSRLMRRSPLKRKKGLRKQSKKQKSRLALYYPIRDEFLKKNKWCVICAALKGRPVPATEVHHGRGRAKELLFDTRFFHATCRGCRLIPHDNPKWAREVGILAEAKDWGVHPPLNT